MSTASDLRWWQRGAIYQIYPRSFADSDGDGVGDLPGVLAHFDHLEELAVEGVWLSPFYPSPMADFGYDVADYCDVDPLFGTLADFDRLVAEAHARGIRVLIDWVPNHTSDRHPWFQASRSSRRDPRRNWYVWRDGRDGKPPNGWRSAFGGGPAWTRDERTGQWYLHTFLPEQPELNWDEPEVRAAMRDTLRFWLDRGVDGFRIDVVHALAKDPALGEDEPCRSHHDDWQPTIHERLRELRAVVDEYGDRILVGEVYLLDLRRVAAYVASGDQLHLAHNFVFLKLPWDAAAFRASIDEFVALSGPAAWPAWFLANHDHPRVASRFGPREARAVLVLLYALRGTPFVFQGEELGLPDADVSPERVVDVDGRDPERAPIPWLAPSQAGAGAGFTTGEPWLPIVSDAERLNVAAQAADPRSTLSLARRLGRLRRAEPVLQGGEQRTLDAGRELLCWVRELQTERMLAVVNFANAPRRLAVRGTELPARGRLLLSSDPDRAEGEVALADLELAGAEAVLVRL